MEYKRSKFKIQAALKVCLSLNPVPTISHSDRLSTKSCWITSENTENMDRTKANALLVHIWNFFCFFSFISWWIVCQLWGLDSSPLYFCASFLTKSYWSCFSTLIPKTGNTSLWWLEVIVTRSYTSGMPFIHLPIQHDELPLFLEQHFESWRYPFPFMVVSRRVSDSATLIVERGKTFMDFQSSPDCWLYVTLLVGRKAALSIGPKLNGSDCISIDSWMLLLLISYAWWRAYRNPGT